jgi:ribosomal subunit interface protein
MKIEIHTDGVILTAKQKAGMEKKLSRMKKFIPDEPLTIDLILKDETSAEKGGIDQKVEINATFGKEKIFVSEVDDRLMRAFVLALKRFERQITRYHRKRIDQIQKTGRLDKIWKIVRRK